MRKIYMGRFVGRCFTLAVVSLLLLIAPEQFSPLQAGRFFQKPTLLHILWIIWVFDMLAQIIPSAKIVTALGSQKSFAVHFRKASSPISLHELRARALQAAKRAYIVFLLWTCLTAALGWLHTKNILSDLAMFWLTTVFYVCDLICVLFWCPFRHFIMKNRCCTTCRIFNWDHLMMFSPLIFVEGFFAKSLVILAVVVFCIWEWTAIRYPERFCEGTNQVLKCAECTDLLCIHAQKIHKH
jgi:hypothetical protein